MDEEDVVNLRFVIPKGKTEASCSEELALTFEASNENGLNPKWISHDETLKLDPVKTDVFVVDPFEGDAFNHISKFKCTVVGPMCLLTCLQKGEPVPQLPYPMYTASMKGVIVTSTAYMKEEKDEIKQKVEQMAGIYSPIFHDGVTHLLAAMVRSKKYDVAVKKDVPVMTIDWVRSVFESSKQKNMHATDPYFTKFRCPALLGLNITASQMSKKDRDLLKKSIESHGGVYSGALDLSTTSILIITKPDGDKYKYARKWKIPCVKSDWVFDSIEKGYCLPTESYRVESGGGNCSTPTKENVPRALEEVSMCSTILMPNDSMVNHVNETMNSSNMTLLGKQRKDSATEKLLEQLSLSRVKKAGAFLEDCKIFVSGFSDSETEYLEKVIITAGGTRMKQMTSSITHMICLKFEKGHYKILDDLKHTPYKVTLQWLVESMFLGRPIEESDFAFNMDENSSFDPAKMDATRGFIQKEQNLKPAKQTLDDEQTQYEDDLLAQYRVQPAEDNFAVPSVPVAGASGRQSNVAAANPADQTSQDASTASTTQNTCSQIPPFLADKKVFVSGFDTDTTEDLKEWILEAGGDVVEKSQAGVIVDFLIVPIYGSDASVKAKEVVTNLWMEDSIDQAKFCPIQYYHRPIEMCKLKSAEKIVIGVTNYLGNERQFIVNLAEALGMISQDIFAKKDKQGAKKSTHLICKTPEGSKYDAAIKWKLPVVTKDWLIACQDDKDLVSEKPFLIGKSTDFTSGRPLPKPKPVLEKANNFVENTEDDDDDEEITFSSKVHAVPETQDLTIPTPPSTRTRLAPQTTPVPSPRTTRLTSDSATSSSAGSSKTGSASSVRTPINSKTAMQTMALDTPAGERLDIEKLRPRPLALNLTEMTPPQRYYADSQPSPSATQQQQQSKKAYNERLPWNLQDAKTPETPYGAFMGGNPSPTTRKIWKQQCDELGRYQLSDAERNEELASRERKRKIVAEAEYRNKSKLNQRVFQSPSQEDRNRMHEKAMDDLESRGLVVLERDPRPFEDIMEEKLNKIGKSWKNAGKRIKLVKNAESDPKKRLFEGVVLFVTKKLSDIQSELHSIIALHGGEYRFNYGPDVTHVVFVGKTNDSTKEFKVAKSENKKIVAPGWVYMCKEEGKLVEEEIFPHTYNPSMNLLDVVFTKSDRKTQRHEPTDNTQKTGNPPDAKKRKKEPVKEEPDLSAELLKLDQLVELSKDETSNTSNRRSIKIKLTSTDLTPERSLSGQTVDSDRVVDIFPAKTQSEPTDSQILWIDPREEAERKKLDAKLAAETQAQKFSGSEKSQTAFDSMEIPENLTEVMMGTEAPVEEVKKIESVDIKTESVNKKTEIADKKTESVPTERPIRFMLSGVQDDDRENFFNFLEKIKIEYSDANSCDPKATHVIASKLSRSEKLLGSIASGKWVLHPSYMDACKKRNGLVAEMEFEWGNSANRFFVSLKTPLEQKLAETSFRWRSIIEKDSNRGPFEGIKAIIHTAEGRKESFRRLLEHGKGQVLTKATPPYKELHGATHCIAEPSKLPNVKIDYGYLAAKNVAVVGPVYINEFLSTIPAPKVEDYLIPEFKQFWENRGK